MLLAPRLVAVNGRAGVVALSAAAAAPGTRMAGKAALWGLVLGLAAWDDVEIQVAQVAQVVCLKTMYHQF